jgi:osmotically-inducible protein OsmY
MTTTLTTVDQALRDTVEQQLLWDPQVDAALIGVTAQDGIVSLTGYVDTYTAKLAAERAARKVFGVKAVVNELDVRLAHGRIDPDLAKEAVAALAAQAAVPKGVAVTVRDGTITLSGRTEWMYQKVAAERAVKGLRGVRGIFNQIEVKPAVSPRDVQKRIVEALHRHADVDARRVHVETMAGTVILSGIVRSWTEKDEAARAAWAAPGVVTVDNRISVVP